MGNQSGALNDQLIENMLAELRAVYEKRDKLDEYNSEEEVFRHLIPKLKKELEPLVLIRPFALGSTATIWEVKDKKLNLPRALKLPRPRLGKIDMIIRIIRAESNRLAELIHQNIIRIHLTDEIKVSIKGDKYIFPFFLMDFLDGVDDLDNYLLKKRSSITAEEIISYFRHVALGLVFLHEKGVIHCDIKPGNIFIAPENPALIADLGYAKHFEKGGHDADGKITTVTCTPRYAHPELRAELKRSTDTAAGIAHISREKLRVGFDLYAFGRSMQEILLLIRKEEAKEESNQSIFSSYQWHYLSLIAVRLLDGQVERQSDDTLKSDVLPDLPSSAMQELAYKSSDDPLEDLEKLLNFYDLEGEIPELNANSSTYIQLPGSRVPFTRRVSRIINHSVFVRLTQITQLGFVSLVYPGCNHTRFEHTLGVFEKCCEIIRGLWYDEVCCLFRSIMSKRDIEAVLVASLIHDIGQYPMAHDLHEVEALFAHDTFTESLTRSLDPSSGESLAHIAKSEWNVEIDEVFYILRADSNSGLRHRILKSIINGPLDSDKLDYLQRDSIHAGVSFGAVIDQSRLLRNLTVCLKSDDKDKNRLAIAEIGVAEKALAIAEGVWRARQEMFRQIYWQHTVRALKAMLDYTVRRLLIRLDTDEAKEDFLRDLHQFNLSPMSIVEKVHEVEKDQDKEIPTITEFDDIVKNSDMGMNEISHLAASDEALIMLIWKYSDNIGKHILNLIRRRRIFKRVAVLSFKHEGAKFDSVYHRFRQERLTGHLLDREVRRKKLEAAVLDKCPESKLLKETIEKGIPIVLVDVPIKALRDPSGKEALWYVPEEYFRLKGSKKLSFASPAKSQIQVEQTSFDKEVGKIRVLVHPSWYEVVSESIKPDKIIDELISKLL